MTYIVTTPFTKGAGYLENGVNLNPSQREKADIRTCTHCQAVIKMQQWKHRGGFCFKCSAPICEHCAKELQTKGCVPFLKKIEAFAEQVMRFDQLGLLIKDDTGSILEQPQINLPV